jgi:hypothetical protein
VGYPNEAERSGLERFPDRIAVEDLRACFALSDRDRVLIFDQRGPGNRLGLAVSLSALRFLGFVPDDIASVPDEAQVFVAGQVDAAPHELGFRTQVCARQRQALVAAVVATPLCVLGRISQLWIDQLRPGISLAHSHQPARPYATKRDGLDS